MTRPVLTRWAGIHTALFPGFISHDPHTLRITYEFSPIFWLRKLTHRQTGGSSPPDELEAGHRLELGFRPQISLFCCPRAGLTRGCAVPEAACHMAGTGSVPLGPPFCPQIDLGHSYQG